MEQPNSYRKNIWVENFKMEQRTLARGPHYRAVLVLFCLLTSRVPSLCPLLICCSPDMTIVVTLYGVSYREGDVTVGDEGAFLDDEEGLDDEDLDEFSDDDEEGDEARGN